MEAKQFLLNSFGTGNEELHRQLISTTNSIGEIIEQHKTVHSQLTKNYNSLWYNYQNKINELEVSKRSQECLSNKLNELNINCENLKCQLKEKDNKHIDFIESYNQLEAVLTEAKNDVTCLKNQNLNLKNSLNITSEDLDTNTQLLKNKICELDHIKLENVELKSKCECLQNKLTQTIEKYNQIELQLNKNENISKTELQIQDIRNIELNQIVNEQKCQLQEKTEILENDNANINALKQMIEENTIQANNCYDKIRKEKLNLENDNEELKTNIKEYIKQLKCLELQNEQFSRQINELQYKLCKTVENSDEMQKLSTENMKKICDDMEKVKTEITLKNQAIAELEEQLLEVKKMHMVETENVCDLKRKLDNLRYKPIKFDQYLNIDSSCQMTDCVSQVIDELQLYSPNMGTKDDYSYSEGSENKNESFDELIVKCNSIVNRYKQTNYI